MEDFYFCMWEEQESILEWVDTEKQYSPSRETQIYFGGVSGWNTLQFLYLGIENAG